MKKIRIFWLAGESSGDLHAALIMQALDPHRFEHVGIGGPHMQALGLEALYPFQRFAVMGFVEVIRHLPFFLKVERRIKKLFKTSKPDLAILVDYPGLNLRIAHLADEFRIPVLYYICPQFWAWKHERVFKLKASVRYVATILPFEAEMLNIHSINSSYVGHPIAEEVHFEHTRESFARFFHLDAKRSWLGFFPGSRDSEVQRILPTFLKAARKWRDHEILVSKSRSVNHQLFMRIWEKYAGPNLHVIDGFTYDMMRACEVVVCTSGTVTLEAAYIGSPAVICYKANPISYLIGRYFVRISRIGLPNIILDQDLLPELVQNEMHVDNIYKEVEALKGARREPVLNELKKLQHILSSKKPSRMVPQIIEELLKTYG